MALEVRPGEVAVDGTCLVSLRGLPDRAVYWSLVNSSGTIAALSPRTDSQGRAAAVFTPANPADLGLQVTIKAEYGS